MSENYALTNLIEGIYEQLNEYTIKMVDPEISVDELNKIWIEDRIEHTLRHYPEMGKSGYLFWGNRDRVYIDKDLNRSERLTKNFSETEILQSYNTLQSIEVYYGFQHIGYDRHNQIATAVYPILVKIADEKTLIKLKALRIRINRWDLMDI